MAALKIDLQLAHQPGQFLTVYERHKEMMGRRTSMWVTRTFPGFFLGSRANLALTEGDGAHFPGELHDVCEFVEVGGRVSPRGQHEDEWRGGR